MNKNSIKYVKRSYKKVEGWISPLALKAILKLGEIQEINKITGSVCEIGVHHGKAFILLHLLTKSNEMSAAIDLFEFQSDNIDNSGKGDKEKLIKNLKNNSCDLERIKIITKNSLDISPDYLLNQTGSKIRFFSVDGGHTAEVVFNDLKLAEQTLCEGGVIILDDFFVNSWPGVSEGTCKYLLSGNTKLIPFSTFDGKILFTNNKNIAGLYINGLSGMHPEFLTKESVFFNSKVIVLSRSRNNSIDFLRRTKLWQLIKNNETGTLIRKALRP